MTVGSDQPKRDELEPQSSVEADDDLESLAGGISPVSASVIPSESEEATNLGALAAVGGQRGTQPDEDDTRLDLGRLVAVARASAPAEPDPAAQTHTNSRTAPAPSSAPHPQLVSALPAPPARASWIVPMLIGLGIGVGVAGTLFGLSARREPSASVPAAVEPVVARNTVEQPAAAPEVAAPEPQAPASTAQSAAPTPVHQADHRVLASTSPAARPISPSRQALPPASIQPVPGAPLSPTASAPSTATQVLAIRPSPAEPATPSSQSETDKNAAPEINAKTGSSNSVDRLLDEALSAPARRDELQHQRELDMEQAQLQLAPSREDVTQAMTVLLPAIRGCAMGQSGLATAGIIVRGDGRVGSVEITGAPFAGTASGRCMEGVIRRAHFPRFKQPTFRIRFPLAIQ